LLFCNITRYEFHIDVRIEGDTDANLFSLDAGLESIGIGVAAPSDTKFKIVRKTTDPTWAFMTEYQTAITNAKASSYVLKTKSTGNMADGFGGGIVFAIEDTANTENYIATIYAERAGADNSGTLSFNTYSAGTRYERLRISSGGNMWLLGDSSTFYFGAGADASILYNGTNFLIDPRVVGSGYVGLQGNVVIGDATAGEDFTLTFDGQSNDGVLTWMEDEDYFKFSDDIYLDTAQDLTLASGSIKLATAQTTTNGLTGTAVSSQPFQGTSYKKFIVYLSNFTSAGTVLTFPTAFTNTPFVYGDAAAIAIAVTSTTTVTLTSVGAVGGHIFVEGY
jgi:hypothetical protein